MESVNITQRKKRTNKHSPEKDSLLFDTSTLSIPCTSPGQINASQDQEDLIEKYYRLENELSSALQVIEQLKSENAQLKNELERYMKPTNVIINTPCSKTTLSRDDSSGDTCIFLTPTNENSASLRVSNTSLPLVHDLHSANQDEDRGDSGNERICSTSNQGPVSITPTANSSREERSTNAFNKDQCPTVAESSCRNRILVLADQQGYNVQMNLQSLVGSKYAVTSYSKPNAQLSEVLSSEKELLKSFTKNDFVVILGGINDKNPIEFQYVIRNYLKNLNNTNIIISEVPYNNFLCEKKLNYELKFICNQFVNTTFVDMDYSRYLPNRDNFALQLSRYILKEVLHIEYKRKYLTYYYTKPKSISMQSTSSCDKSTQTPEIFIDSNCASGAPDHLFRV